MATAEAFSLSDLSPEEMLRAPLPPADDLLVLEQAIEAEEAIHEVAEQATISLGEFVKRAWHLVEPRDELVWNWHLDIICDRLERVSHGEIRRLVINVPPGCMKSLLVSVLWPAWEWLHNPWMRLQCLSAADSNVTRDAGKMRRIVKSKWYRRLVRALEKSGGPEAWKIEKDTERYYDNGATGVRQSITIGSEITGARAYRQIIDDPHDIDDVLGTPDQVERNLARTVDRVEKVLASRIQSQRGESFVLIMQRLHENDLSSIWLGKEDCEAVVLPMRYDPNHEHVCADDPRTELGELLQPDLYDEERIRKDEAGFGDLGPAMFGQRPRPLEGGTYKAEYWREYEGAPRDLILDDIGIAIDPNVKETKHGSYFTAAVWGRRFRMNGHGPAGFDRFLLAEYRARAEYIDALEEVIRLRFSWPQCSVIAIEDKANGPAMASALQRKFSGVILVPRVSTQSKEVYNQVHGVPPCRAGEVFLPTADHAHWIHDWRAEHERFPATPNDRPDTTALMFDHWAEGQRTAMDLNLDAFAFLGA